MNPDIFDNCHIVMAMTLRTLCALTLADQVSAAFDTSIHLTVKARGPAFRPKERDAFA